MDVTRWRERLTDERVADAILVLAGLALTVLAVKGRWVMLPPAVIAVAGAAGSVAQWPRRRRPLFAAAVGSLAYVLSGNPGPLVVGLYSGAVYAPRRRVPLVALAGVVGIGAWSWIDQRRLDLNDVLAAVTGTALVVAIGIYITTRRALTASLRERAEQAEAERRLRDERARTAERTRIAREMHDVLAHKVSLIALHAGALELHTTGGADRVREGAELIRVTAREALQELRYVLGVLQDGVRADPEQSCEPDPTDLAALVRAAVEAGQPVELDDRAGELPAPLARVVHRVAQEGLTNARKHAPSAPVVVATQRGPDGAVTVSVTNQAAAGPALDLPGSGSGLIGLAERIRLAGGTIHSGPMGERGWQLRAVIPVGEAR